MNIYNSKTKSIHSSISDVTSTLSRYKSIEEKIKNRDLLISNALSDMNKYRKLLKNFLDNLDNV